MNAHALQFLITQRNFLAATFKLKSDKSSRLDRYSALVILWPK